MTALALSNASMLDEGTAAAEAMTLARRSSKAADSAVFVIDSHLHTQTKAVVATRAKPLGIEILECDALNIPSGIFKNISFDYRWSDRSVVSRTDE